MGNTVLQETQRMRRAQETEMLLRALRTLRGILPETWHAALEPSTNVLDQDHATDGALVIKPPRGHDFTFGIEAKTRITSGAAHLTLQAAAHHRLPLPAVVVTEYASPALRSRCEAAGIGYLDTTGWVHLQDDRGLLLRSEGLSRAPVQAERRKLEIARLDGPGASRVIRALWSATCPIGVRALAREAATSPGTVAKVLPTLERHGAVTRDEDGTILQIDPVLILDRWTQDYRFLTSNHPVRWLLAPRGIDRVLSRLEESVAPVVLTGHDGARAYLPVDIVPAIPRALLAAYTAEPDLLADELRLVPSTPEVANVVLARPRDHTLLRSSGGPAPLVQVLADLTTMGSRYPELGQQLLRLTFGERSGH